jgi:hypothetical protein
VGLEPLVAGEGGRRNRPLAARLFADGVALSMMSFGRVTSAGASCPVVNTPPCSSSQNSSIKASATWRASAIHRASPVASARRVNASSNAPWSAL